MKIELVINTLLNVAGVTALVGTRIYPVVIPKSAGSPVAYVVYMVVSNAPRPTIDGGGGYKGYVARIQVTAAAATHSQLKAVVQAVRDALHLQRGTIAGVNVTSVALVGEGPEDYDSGEKLFVQPIDFMVVHRE